MDEETFEIVYGPLSVGMIVDEGIRWSALVRLLAPLLDGQHGTLTTQPHDYGWVDVRFLGD